MLNAATVTPTDQSDTTMTEDTDRPPSDAEELTEDQKRQNVIRLAFSGDESRYTQFCDVVRSAVPERTLVVLRGSAVTGHRWRDHAPFDSDGDGTSDLDLTLVGEEAIKLFKATGFYVPLVHSRPVSDKDPDIAPELTPLRDHLMAMVGRPVNIQATRDFVMHLRGDLMGQPYLVLVDRPPDEPDAGGSAGAADS
jgi:hypothetical protein